MRARVGLLRRVLTMQHHVLCPSAGPRRGTLVRCHICGAQHIVLAPGSRVPYFWTSSPVPHLRIVACHLSGCASAPHLDEGLSREDHADHYSLP